MTVHPHPCPLPLWARVQEGAARYRTVFNVRTTLAYDYEQMMSDEWLEADGLGGFASGTVSGIRTRRYHALLLAATRPPAGRLVLVNGFDASVETANGNFALSSHLYPLDTVHPDGARRIVEFTAEPWPKWIFALEDGTKIQQEIFAVHDTSIVVLCWRLLNSTGQCDLDGQTLSLGARLPFAAS